MMLIDKVTVSNFASYQYLEFDFHNKGLTLISGPTGSGKSTLCDIIPWILFGKTAKDGSVDEVRSWNNSDPTKGSALIDMASIAGKICITRVRGKSNDLYFTVGPGVEQRGKDINDTQGLINRLLGLDYCLYMYGSYLHEFSPATSFFTATAKNRRQLTEQVVDLSLSKNLEEALTDYKKQVKEELDKYTTNLTIKTELKARTESYLFKELKAESLWESIKVNQIIDLESKSKTFKQDQEQLLLEALDQHRKQSNVLKDMLEDAKIGIFTDEELAEQKTRIETMKSEDLDDICKECGNSKNSHKKLLIVKAENELRLKETTNDYKKTRVIASQQNLDRHNAQKALVYEKFSDKENPYVSQIAALKAQSNPHKELITQLTQELIEFDLELKDLTSTVSNFRQEMSDIKILSGIAQDFRALLIKNTIVELQESTNRFLTDFFDSEIRVTFKIDADKLDVSINKDENTCSYAQLSKGQRQLLKLCFGISVMRIVQNHNSIKSNVLFFDEALDGMDDTLKLKAFNLLNKLSLEHESIFVVEHNEAFKTMFPKEIKVSLANGTSALCQS